MDWIMLIGFLGAVMAAGTTGAIFPPGEWYERLDKPSWTPPNWLFPIAWTALYLAMVWAAYRVGTSGAPNAPAALAVWAGQITLNALWTPVFFGLRKMGRALIVVVALWAMVALTMVLFFTIDLVAGLLLVPYLIWVSYASALNAKIVQLNR